MFATLIEFKDAALAGTALATAAGTLARALRSDSFFLFGPECFRSGISGASESDLAHVASLLEPGNTFRECSAHIASALLLVSQVSGKDEKSLSGGPRKLASFTHPLTECRDARKSHSFPVRSGGQRASSVPSSSSSSGDA